MKYLPNLFSGARLLLAPYIFWLMWRRDYGAGLIWFLFCGITDGIDGWIARAWNAQSRLGAMLDPIGDKLLLSGSFVVLAIDGQSTTDVRALQRRLLAIRLGDPVTLRVWRDGTAHDIIVSPTELDS